MNRTGSFFKGLGSFENTLTVPLKNVEDKMGSWFENLENIKEGREYNPNQFSDLLGNPCHKLKNTIIRIFIF